MAQLINTKPSAPNQDFTHPSYADVPGLSIVALNGSGWIILSYSMTLSSNYAGAQTAYVRILIDGEALADSERAVSFSQSFIMTHTVRIPTRPGAGQHVYKLQAKSQNATVTISDEQATFSIEEPGY